MTSVLVVQWETLKEVRYEVLWPHLKSAEDARIDIDESEGAIHLAGMMGEAVVGVASLFLQECDRFPGLFEGEKVYRLRAMGVLGHVRGNGVGEAIINEAVNILKGEEVKVIWCDAREVAWGFYERCGFSFVTDKEGVECGAYAVPNIGMHKMMYRRL
jgi:ribosomal-protein-alanine N-acetyltransferase